MPALELGPMTLRGHRFSRAELGQIREIVESSHDEHRFGLSKKICRVLRWYQRNGRLKDRACRDVLDRLKQIGLLELPPCSVRPHHPMLRRALDEAECVTVIEVFPPSLPVVSIGWEGKEGVEGISQ